MRIFQLRITDASEAGARDGGYTLLELLVVVAIIAMALAATPTLYARMVPNFEVRQFASDVATFARRARERAKRSQTVTGFLYSPAGEVLASLDDEELSIPSGVAISFERAVDWHNVAENRVEFYPSGASSGGRIEIRRGGVMAAVTIDWVSGAVKVEH